MKDCRVNLTVGGKTVKRRVHRLVCEAWHGLPPTSGHHAAHLDGNSSNNRQWNLAWATPKENNADKRLHGTHQAGAKHPRAKLTPHQVEAIRESRLSSRALARAYGVSQSQVVRIKNGDRWAEPVPVSSASPLPSLSREAAR